jgi:hypothetical protein
VGDGEGVPPATHAQYHSQAEAVPPAVVPAMCAGVRYWKTFVSFEALPVLRATSRAMPPAADWLWYQLAPGGTTGQGAPAPSLFLLLFIFSLKSKANLVSRNLEFGNSDRYETNFVGKSTIRATPTKTPSLNFIVGVDFL